MNSTEVGMGDLLAIRCNYWIGVSAMIGRQGRFLYSKNTLVVE